MAIDDFLEHVQRQAGESLRVVTWYSADEYGGLYTRPDLNPDRVNQRIKHLSSRLMDSVESRQDPNPLQSLGDELAMVQVREGAVIIRFPLEEQRGLIVSLDIDVATSLHSFISECAERLEGESLSFRSGAIA